MRSSFPVLVLIGVLAASGCATRYKAAHAEGTPFLHVEPVADGCVLSWVSQPGMLYTVLYSESLTDQQWKGLPGFVNIEGTGRNLRAPDIAPENRTRFYRLHVGPYTGP